MALFGLALILIILITILCSFFITKKAHRKLQEQNNKNADGWGILIFVLSFIIIGIGLYLLIASNVNFGR